MKDHLKRWLPVYLWLMVIFTLSSIPHLNLPRFGFRKMDKILHFSEYLILGFLLRRGFSSRPKGVLFLTIFCGFLTAFLDEIHQLFIPGRKSEVWDFIMNSAGILLAQISVRIVR